MRLLIDEARPRLETDGEVTLDLDCEWDIDHTSVVDNCKVDVIQIAFARKAYVLHVEK